MVLQCRCLCAFFLCHCQPGFSLALRGLGAWSAPQMAVLQISLQGMGKPPLISSGLLFACSVQVVVDHLF